MGELWCEGVAVWGSCNVGKLECGGVVMWGSCSVGELRCGGVEVLGSRGVLDLRSIILAGPFSQGITAWTLQCNSVEKGGQGGVIGLHLQYILQKKVVFGCI